MIAWMFPALLILFAQPFLILNSRIFFLTAGAGVVAGLLLFSPAYAAALGLSSPASFPIILIVALACHSLTFPLWSLLSWPIARLWRVKGFGGG